MVVRTILAWGMVLTLLPGVALAQAVKRCPAQLPAPVAAKRDAIVTAAKAKDWPALQKLIGPGEFVFSFGGDSDAIAYWQDLVKQGTDIPRYLVSIFAMGCVVTADTGAYLFPAAGEIEWKNLTAAEKQAMLTLYGKEIDEWYVEGRAKGYYIGWRGVIEKSGAWSAFVAGD